MAPAGALELRSVSRFYGGFAAVREVSFTLQPGEICGYLGANGSGKTTTVRMLTGLLPPTRGEILYDDRDIGHDLPGFRAILGYVPEEPYLYNHLSGVEYLELVGALRRVPEGELRRRIPATLEILGFGAERDGAIQTYSKGMKQKILLAAALLHDPDVLVLDEPLSGLDVNTVQLVRELFAQLAERGKIVLYSSHILEVVERICTRVIMLHRGSVVADDSVANLRALTHAEHLESVFAQLTQATDFKARAAAWVDACAR